MKQALAVTDLRLLVFLILFLNVSMAAKLGALFLMYLSRPNFKFGLRKKRLPLFYPAMMLLCILQFAIHHSWSTSSFLVSALGIGYWAICFLVVHQVKLSIEADARRTENALTAFFILNCIVSAWQLVMTMLDSGSINPYTYEGMDLKYHTSTGDYIKGILFDTSNANMIINAFALFYFLRRQRYILSLLALIVALLATSNLGNLILLFFLLYIILIDQTKLHKLIALCFIGVMVIFLAKVSPNNFLYFYNKAGTILSTKKPSRQEAAPVAPPASIAPQMTEEQYLSHYINELEKKQAATEEITIRKQQLSELQKPRPLKKDSSYTGTLQSRHDYLIAYAQKTFNDTVLYHTSSKIPGKLIAMQQTLHYTCSSPLNLLLGAGPGNFSSKLAFKVSGIDVYGHFPKQYAYISPPFKDNHLRLFCYYFLMPPAEHSVINTPNSVFNQLLGEYGLIGLALFLLLYVWFFARHYRWLNAGKIILPMFLAFLFTEYWFEQFSVVVLFEAVLLLEIQTMHQNTSES